MNHRWMLPLVDKEDIKALRHFAIGFSILLSVVFCLLLPWLFAHAIPVWPIVVVAMLLALYVFFPKWLFYPYVVWMVFASVMSWINTRLIMFIAYYLLMVPIGLCVRVFKKLQYKRRFADVESYWIKRTSSPKKQQLKEPY